MYYDTTRAMPGLNLLDQKSRSLLLDMKGNVLREFPFGFIKVLPDGTMLGASDSTLAKFDVNCKIIWQVPVMHIHHEITVDDNGAIYLFTSRMEDHWGLKIRFDVIQIFSSQGKLIYTWSIADHLNQYFCIISKSATLKDMPIPFDSTKDIKEYISQAPERFFIRSRNYKGPAQSYELSHFNSIQVLPETPIASQIPAFKKGNLLISLNPYSSYGIFDTATGSFEWVGYLPEATRLHCVNLTPQNTILVFQNSTEAEFWDEDNMGIAEYIKPLNEVFSPKPFIKPVGRLWVSISEYDPLTNNKLWEYTADPKESLTAHFLGSAQRLSNGNTLVFASTELEGGKGFELDKQKKIVWLYLPKEKDWETHMPAAFYRMTRIDTGISNIMTKLMR